MANRKKVLHVRSSQLNNVPSSSTLDYGEIAVNFNADYPNLYIKDSNNNVIPIAGSEYWKVSEHDEYAEAVMEVLQALQDAKVDKSASAATITSASTDEQWATAKAVYTEVDNIKTIIEDNEEVTAAALNYLDTNKVDESAFTEAISNVYTKAETEQTIEYAIQDKADISAVTAVNNVLTAHTADTTIHITSAERSKWNGKIDDAVYISSSHTIEFTSVDDGVVTTIDATDFIKDGMVSSAYVSGSDLVIVFNTDSGKDPIYIPTSAIFDTNLYYTKSETDDLLDEKQDNLLYYYEDNDTVNTSMTINAGTYLSGENGSYIVNGEFIPDGEDAMVGIRTVIYDNNNEIISQTGIYSQPEQGNVTIGAGTEDTASWVGVGSDYIEVMSNGETYMETETADGVLSKIQMNDSGITQTSNNEIFLGAYNGLEGEGELPLDNIRITSAGTFVSGDDLEFENFKVATEWSIFVEGIDWVAVENGSASTVVLQNVIPVEVIDAALDERRMVTACFPLYTSTPGPVPRTQTGYTYVNLSKSCDKTPYAQSPQLYGVGMRTSMYINVLVEAEYDGNVSVTVRRGTALSYQDFMTLWAKENVSLWEIDIDKDDWDSYVTLGNTVPLSNLFTGNTFQELFDTGDNTMLKVLLRVTDNGQAWNYAIINMARTTPDRGSVEDGDTICLLGHGILDSQEFTLTVTGGTSDGSDWFDGTIRFDAGLSVYEAERLDFYTTIDCQITTTQFASVCSGKVCEITDASVIGATYDELRDLAFNDGEGNTTVKGKFKIMTNPIRPDVLPSMEYTSRILFSISEYKNTTQAVELLGNVSISGVELTVIVKAYQENNTDKFDLIVYNNATRYYSEGSSNEYFSGTNIGAITYDVDGSSTLSMGITEYDNNYFLGYTSKEDGFSVAQGYNFDGATVVTYVNDDEVGSASTITVSSQLINASSPLVNVDTPLFNYNGQEVATLDKVENSVIWQTSIAEGMWSSVLENTSPIDLNILFDGDHTYEELDEIKSSGNYSLKVLFNVTAIRQGRPRTIHSCLMPMSITKNMGINTITLKGEGVIDGTEVTLVIDCYVEDDDTVFESYMYKSSTQHYNEGTTNLVFDDGINIGAIEASNQYISGSVGAVSYDNDSSLFFGNTVTTYDGYSFFNGYAADDGQVGFTSYSSGTSYGYVTGSINNIDIGGKREIRINNSTQNYSGNVYVTTNGRFLYNNDEVLTMTDKQDLDEEITLVNGDLRTLSATVREQENVVAAALVDLETSKLENSAITTSITSASTDAQVPSAGAVYREHSLMYRGIVTAYTGTSLTGRCALDIQATGITEYRDGLMIMVRNGSAGTSATTATSMTVNINKIGAKPLYRSNSNNSIVTNHWAAYNTYLIIYDSSCDAFIWQAGYDANTDTIAYSIRRYGGSYTVAGGSLTRLKLLFQYSETSYIPSTFVSNNTGTSKTLMSESFNPYGQIFYYPATTTIAQGGEIPVASAWSQYNVDLRYSFNTSSSLTANRDVFLKCSPQSDGRVKFATGNPITQTLPSTEDGYVYIYLGPAYSVYQLQLTLEHPIYEYKNGAIRLWNKGVTDLENSVITALTEVREEVSAHTTDADIHVTLADKASWNEVSGKVDTTAITSSITSESTDDEIPTAKATYETISGIMMESEYVIATSLNDLNERLEAFSAYVMSNYVKNPVVLYEDATGLTHNDNWADTWQLTGLDFSPYKYVRVYIKPSQTTIYSTGTYDRKMPAMILTISLNAADLCKMSGNTMAYCGTVAANSPANTNISGSYLCAIDDTKTKFKCIRLRYQGSASTTSGNLDDSETVYKIEGCFG